MTERVLKAAGRFEPRVPALGAARSLVAVAQLSVLLGTPRPTLFLWDRAVPREQRCAGLTGASLWCGGGDSPVVLVAAAAVLAAVAVGLSPRWTCVPHFYVSWSLVADLAAPNGGDQVAQLFTMLVIPACLADSRRWQWTRALGEAPPALRGAAMSAAWMLRLQLLIIYTEACLAKTLHPSWRDGRALAVILDDPGYGAPTAWRPWVHWATTSAAGRAMTWSVLAAELTIAVTALIPAAGRVGLGLTVGLHLAIIVLMGLFSFGVIMIAVRIALGDHTRPAGLRRPSTNETERRLTGPAFHHQVSAARDR